MESKAYEFFTQAGHPFNCAQALMMGAGHPERKDEMAACGGGRAPGGMCGALYAALQLTPAERHEALIAAFKARVGATTCREIKGAATPVPCAQCVAIADELRLGK